VSWLRTGRPGFDPRQRQRIFPLTSASRPSLGPTQPPVQCVPGVKRGRSVMLTTHYRPVPRLRNSRSCTSSPLKRCPWRVVGLLYPLLHTWMGGGGGNIKMSFKEIRHKDADWVRLAQDRVRWWTVDTTVMNFSAPQKVTNFLSVSFSWRTVLRQVSWLHGIGC
jgi:hypothetical protein